MAPKILFGRYVRHRRKSIKRQKELERSGYNVTKDPDELGRLHLLHRGKIILSSERR